MKCFIRPIDLADALFIAAYGDTDEIEQALSFGFRGTIEDLAIGMTRATAGWTIVHEASGEILAAGGFTELRKGVYQTWFLPRPGVFHRYGRELTVICAKSIRNLLANGAHRVETVSLLNRTLAHRWYEAIGMVRESESPGYGINGETAVTYVRLR